MNITISDISFKYKNASIEALQHLSLSIKKGEKHGIFGSNGAGKSTLIKLICQVLQPQKGNIVFSNESGPLASSSVIKQNIGYVPQDLAFYEELNLIQNIEYYGVMYNLSNDLIQERSKDLIHLLGLLEKKNLKLKKLSGGMKRKVNLLLALLHDPEIIILDEPTVGIDVFSKNEIIKHLNYLNEVKGKTIIYTSHEMSESQNFCSNFTLLDLGKVLVSGNLEDVLHHQQQPNLEAVLIQLHEKA